jgi:hypothetical protein
MSYLFEAVHNSIFTGTCINGVITVSNYYDSGASTITANVLRGASVIMNRRLVGYIANNSKWLGGGFTAYLAYSEYNVDGLCEIQFIFPYGRTYLISTPINMKSVCVLPTTTKATLNIYSQPKLPNIFNYAIKICTNSNNVIHDDIIATLPDGSNPNSSHPETVTARGGVRFENY